MPTSLLRMQIVATQAAGTRDESQAIGVTVQRDEPSIEAEKMFSARVIDGKKQAGNLSVAIPSLGQAAINPLMEARSALGRRDYATALQLFEACDRKDVVAAIEEALLALDHRDYATALRLFEAVGQKGSAASEVNESGLAPPAPPEPVALGASPISASMSWPVTRSCAPAWRTLPSRT
jgi:hypothetical protein